ncbi:MAG: phosphonate ABC transporter, permease protein PhnE [Euzebyales bacterium]|nr:phosphonate ABC transporter, permease protein PhnE [Euzebyales bacterium]
MTKLDTPIAAVSQARPRRPRATGRLLLNAALAVLFLGAALTVEVDLTRLLEAPAAIWRILVLMFSAPDWSELERASGLMLESIHIAWIGTIMGAILSLPLAFLAAKNVTSRTGSTVVRQVLNAIRAVPELILAIAFIPIVGLGAFAGTMAIGLHSIGTLGKLASEAIEGIDPGPVEAATSVGAPRMAVMRWGVLPQVLPEIVAFWLYRFEINIRAAAILGIVGAGGIGEGLSQTIIYRRWDRAGVYVIVIVLATVAIDAVSSRIRRRIIGGGDRAIKTEADMVTDGHGQSGPDPAKGPNPRDFG